MMLRHLLMPLVDFRHDAIIDVMLSYAASLAYAACLRPLCHASAMMIIIADDASVATPLQR